MSCYVKEEVKKLKAYTVEPDRPEKMLDANENPYELPAEIVEKLKYSMPYGALNRYPDSRAMKLCNKLAGYVGNGVNGDMIIVGDGSDELINIIVSSFISKGKPIIIPTPSFSMYNIYSSINEGKVICFDRENDFSINIDRLIEVAKKQKPGLVFLCNPNNPTGTLTDRHCIIRLLQNCGCMVVIDEAYFEFADFTVVDLVNDYDNLIILRTLSKAWGLAGLRLGYLISNINVINELLKVKSPFNVNTITQEAACLVLDYEEYMKDRVAAILKERNYLIEGLKKIKSLKLYDTTTNFILVKVPDANEFCTKLREKGIAIRNFSNTSMLEDCVRITVGTRDENNSLIDEIKVIAGEYLWKE